MVISKETKKNFLLSLLSGLLSLVLCGVLVEAFLDFKYEKWHAQFALSNEWYGGLTIISQNPNLLWEYRPDAASDVPGLPTIRTNRYGFRDYDYESMAKPVDVFRISFIGDSVTLGLKVDSRCTFVNKFKTYAGEKYPDLKLQVMNHGIDGYNTKQIFELLSSKILQFEPDKIVYVMNLNDFDFEESGGRKLRYFNKPNSHVLEMFEKLYRRLLKIDFHLWHFKKNKRQVFDKIVEMKDLLHAKNIGFEIIVLPVFRFADDDFASYPLSEMHFVIRQFLIQEKIDFIDLLEAFKDQEKPPEYFAYDIWHPNTEGHDFIAKQLLQFLLRDM